MNELKDFLKILGFKPKEGESNYWYKQYKSFSDYEISVIIKSSQDVVINFGKLIQVERKTTSSLNISENYVVLECVNRLIEKGYSPENIILEKKWKLGHTGKGFLDIQVLDNSRKSFLMIECKTYGKEHSKAKKDTESNGGQLFSYFIQERNTQYLCLYSSTFERNEIKYLSDIIVIQDKIRTAENSQEAFEKWSPQVWETKGIFGEEDKSYSIEFKGILKKELRPLTKEDGGNIYNKFAEILRKNVVSDKTNAFNKIFNLFLCKIVDEYETSDEDEMQFQWKESETSEDVMIRLNDLYKRGMELYLDLKIEAVSEKELQEELDIASNKENIKRLFIRQKLYSSNEFAFKEVFDKKTFEDNCIVVKEVVKLLEKYQIKYTTKQQFLGDFFERLLNTGIKQESGQFFTPIPIAQFICKSIPIKHIIDSKNEQKEPYFLPYLIDYASGSGHFLTEVMEEIDSHIKGISEKDIKCGEKHKREFILNKDSFLWAKEYVYGIEKDYRLAKTTKISTFLNGDGDANVICGDGLDDFSKSKEYKKKLKTINIEKENREFDILIANPPYSVDGFKTTLKYGKESFELYPYLTDQSSEIECLFIERAKQLLKDGGVAGIILPISILSNGKIHMRARELILKYFEIKAIVEFGANTFMATGTKTATLFLRRRNNNEWKGIQNKVDEFFTNFRDVTVNGIESVFSKYVECVFENISLKDYVSFFTSDASEEILNHEIIKDYKSAFKKLSGSKLTEVIQDVEKEKLLYFILTYNQKYVLVKAPSDNNEEKEFLGYEFSNRRGNEGIKIYKDENGNNVTKLFNSDYEALYDVTKVNSYILKAFENKEILEPIEELKEVLQIQILHESIDFESANFEKRISTEFGKKKVTIISKWQIVKLKEIATVEAGQSPKSKFYNKESKGLPFYQGKLDFSDRYLKEPRIWTTKTTTESIKNDILLSVRAPVGNVNINPYDKICIGRGLHAIRSSNAVISDYVWYYLNNNKDNIKSLANKGTTFNSISKEQVQNILIPLPPLDIQEKIVRVMEAIEFKEKEIEDEERENREEIEKIVRNATESNLAILGEVCDVRDGTHDSPKYYPTGYPLVTSKNITNGRLDFDGAKLISKEDFEQINKRSLVEKGDVLFAMIGTIGSPVLVDTEKEFAIKNVALFKFKDNNKLLNVFLKYILESELIKDKLANESKGKVQKFVSLQILRNLKIPLPSILEQEKIVRQIEKIEARQAVLKEQRGILEERKKEVMQNYL